MRVPPAVRGGVAGHVQQVGDVAAGEEQAVADAPGAASRGLAMAADVDRDPSRHGLGIGARPPKRHELAIERHVVFGPHLPHDLHVLLGSGAAALPRNAQSLELLTQPADAHAQRDPALRQHVQGGHLLGEGERMALRQKRDARGQPDGGSDGGGIAEPHQRVGYRVVARARHLAAGRVRVRGLVALGVQDVLHRPQRVEPRRLGGLSQAGRTLAFDECADVRERDAELHLCSLLGADRPR